MKKIITALTVTVLTLAAAFADVSLEFTQYAVLLGDNGNLDFNGYSGKFDGNATANGNWKFTIKNKNAGVWLTVKPSLQDGNPDAVKASEYVGWTNFFDGAMKLQAGQWEARTAKRFANGGKLQGTQYERYKMGVVKGLGNTSAAADSNRLTDKQLAAQITYTMDGGAWVTGVLHQGDYDTTSGTQQKAGWAAEFGTSVGEGSRLIVDFKNFKQDQYSVAAFVENSTLKEGLDFTAGFSLGREATGSFSWAIDFRGEYDLADNLRLATMNNLTYNTLGTVPVYNLWDMVCLSTELSDQLTALFIVHWEHNDLMKVAATGRKATLDFAPMVKYQVGKGVDLTGGLNIRTSSWDERSPDTMNFEVPFILHVSM